ncbi:MAG TPA: hypothetical protein VFZ67_07080 [Nitrososphaera sp.]
MSLLGTSGAIAAMAQEVGIDQILDQVQAIGVETGGNTQTNVAIVEQDAENEVEISSEANSESEAEAEISVKDSIVFAESNQEVAVEQENELEDNVDVEIDAEQEDEQELEDATATAFSIRDILIALGLYKHNTTDLENTYDSFFFFALLKYYKISKNKFPL